MLYLTHRKRLKELKVIMPDLPLGEHDQAENVLVEASLAEYKQGVSFFMAYLGELNVNLFIAERIFQFPLELLFGGGPDNAIFFGQVVRNALQMSVLCITKLVSDAGDGLYTLKQFKNKVLRMVKPEYQRAFRKRLKVAWDDSSVQDLLQRARNLRNTRIAHFHRSFVQESFDSTMRQEDLLFSEVKALCDKLNVMFQALAFGIHYGMLPYSYEAGHADIDDVLNRLAQTSDWVNMAERNPALCQQSHQNLPEEEARVIHFYRRKFGLEKSDFD